MAHSTDIVAYTYAADNYCPPCTLAEYRSHRQAAGMCIDSVPIGANRETFTVESALDDYASMRGIDRYTETSFDSGEFPKVVFRDQLESLEHCGRCGGVLGD